MVPAVRPLGPLSMARGCARINSRPDTAKIGSADRVAVHHARLLAVIGVRKTFPHGLDPKRTSGRHPNKPFQSGIVSLSDWLGWTHEAVRISRCARRCGGYTGRMYRCIARCGRKGVRKGVVGEHHVVRVSVFNLCRTIGLQKRAGTIASCRPKCGPHLPRSDESWTDIGTSSQGSSTH